MGDRKGLAGPGHGDPHGGEQGVGVVVPAVTAGGVGVEHHPHLDAALMGPEQGRFHRLGLEFELLEQQLYAGLIDQFDHRLGPVIGHNQQGLLMGGRAAVHGYWDLSSCCRASGAPCHSGGLGRGKQAFGPNLGPPQLAT